MMLFEDFDIQGGLDAAEGNIDTEQVRIILEYFKSFHDAGRIFDFTITRT
ncbi:hypothetical protein [Desulfobacter vibrioformis]|nr:hypothetical protein [Desulfobacter vibrioformis]